LLPDSVRAPAQALILLILAFSSLYFVAGEDGAPGGHLFALLCVYVTALLGGLAISFLDVGLPPLLGMLVMGFLMRNIPYIGENVGDKVNSQWSSSIRLLALALILCRAGLGLDIDALKRLRWVVIRLAALPCFSEATVIAFLAHFLLDFPIGWAAMLGFVVAAVSPAVVVPSLLSLQDRGYGVATGIPTMVVAAAALDDVFSIAGFGICLGFAIESDDGYPLWFQIARAPLEIIIGTSAGFFGAFVLVLTLKPIMDAKESIFRHAVLLFAVSVTCSFGLKKAGMSGASALAVLVLAAAAGYNWGSPTSKQVAATYGQIWNHIAQPLLFGLVGAAVSVKSLEASVVGIGIGMLACSLLVRCAVTFLAVGGQGLRTQERFFAALSWMPKATVQAALGAVALDEATNDAERSMGRDVLAIAVLSILCTAPAGAVVISIMGPKLLILDKPADADGCAKDGQPASAVSDAELKDSTLNEDNNSGAVVVKSS